MIGDLAGCSTKKGAKPTATPNPIEITFSPWGQNGWWQKYVPPGIAKFEAANPTIKVTVSAPVGGGGMAEQIIGGGGADVFEDWVLPPYLNPNLVLKLDTYMQQDGIKASLWSPGQMRALTIESGTYFLPCYIHVDAMAINLSNLDALGLPYPDLGWDYTAAAKAWKAATVTRNGQSYVGINPDYSFTNIGGASNDTRAWALHIMGGSVMDSTRTVCTVDSDEVVAAVDWWNEINWSKVAGGGDISSGTTYQLMGSNEILTALENYGTSFKWTIFPVPKYPAGQISFEALDYHAINGGTKHPDQAWMLLKYLAADTTWSMHVAQYTLRPPSLIAAWEPYVALVEQVAPIAKNLGFSYFIDAAKDWGYAGRTFKYQDATALNLINQGLATAAANQGQTSRPALQAAAQAVNQVMQQAISTAASESKSGASPSSAPNGSQASSRASSSASTSSSGSSSSAKTNASAVVGY